MASVVHVNNTNGNNMGSPRKRARTEIEPKVTVILGAQWGDEGKGKVVDMLATDADVVCRCQVIKNLLIVMNFLEKKIIWFVCY